MNAALVLESVAAGLQIAAQSLPAPWSSVALGLGAVLRFIGRMLARGVDPVATIAALESCLPDVDAARQRLRQYADSLSLERLVPGLHPKDKGEDKDAPALAKEDGELATTIGLAVSGGLNLVVGLVSAGVDPVVVVTELESCLPDLEAAQARLRAYLKTKTEPAA